MVCDGERDCVDAQVGSERDIADGPCEVRVPAAAIPLHHGDVCAKRGDLHNDKQGDTRLESKGHQRVDLHSVPAVKPEQRSEQVGKADSKQHDVNGEYAALAGSQNGHLVCIGAAFYQDITNS